jgi:ABC-type glycerol-3-phosphate transport system substrate-binding protein
VFTDNNGARNALNAGQAAMINASNSRLNEGTNALCPEQGEVPCPSGEVIQGFHYPGDGGVLAFSHQIYIPRVAANVELAQAFAREQILSEYAQTWSAINFGKMPTIWANYDALPENVNFELVRTELEGPAMGQWQYRDGQLLRQAYVDELQRYLIGDQTFEEMIENLHVATDSADLTVPGTEM